MDASWRFALNIATVKPKKETDFQNDKKKNRWEEREGKVVIILLDTIKQLQS